MHASQNDSHTVSTTIGHLVNEVSSQYPENMALIHSDCDIRYDYRQFLLEVNRLAKGFLRLGVNIGDKVALCASNIPEWIIAQMALAKTGAVIVPLDHGLAEVDFQYILQHSESRYIIMEKGLGNDEHITTLSGSDYRSLFRDIIIIGDNPPSPMTSWRELTDIGDSMDDQTLSQRESEIKPGDPVAIMYTSGTTGKPKGVVLDHLGLINKSLFSARRQGLNDKDKLCLFFPLFHMFGNTCIALTGILRGATVVMPCRIFESSKILSGINEEKCTAIYGSPSMLIELIDSGEFRPEKWKQVKKGTIGGSPCPIELMRRLVEDIGVSDITVAYGITETSSWITMTRPEDPLDLRVSTIGTALECNEVNILDPISGDELPADTQGELCTRGFLMKGYYKMPVATASAIDKDGWFHSGDLGKMDDHGYVKITGRLKDVIVRNGVEIYPTELEETIYKLPEVSEVQVFGFTHPKKGREVAAWIKLKEGAQLSLDDLVTYGKENFDGHKEPHYYKLVTDFPMTRSGKVQKFRLAEMAVKEYT